jgi:hypothetical protein
MIKKNKDNLIKDPKVRKSIEHLKNLKLFRVNGKPLKSLK